MPPSNLARLRKVCLSLPDATEVGAWGSPTFRVGKIFAMYANNHHGDGREGVWVKTGFLNQDLLISSMPSRYFMPAYVGPYGWTGVVLDGRTDWESLAELLKDSYRMVASKRRVAALDALSAPDTSAVKAGATPRAKTKAPPKSKVKRAQRKAPVKAKRAKRRVRPTATSKR